MTNAIEVEHLQVSLGNKLVLNDLSLEVPTGTVCSLLGPNGAGKTSLIKTLVNIHPITAGTATILGVISPKLAPADFERIGYVSESQELPLWMTVGHFLSFCRSLYTKWDTDWEDSMLREMDLVSQLHTPLKDLSRGMRVKASLISSLAYHPELLILDEPFSGLDPVVRDEFIDAVIRLAADFKATTLISSHDLAEVERISDSIAFLIQGKIVTHLELDNLLGKFKSVTVQLSSASTRPSNLPTEWLRPEYDGNLLRFIDSNFERVQLSTQIQGIVAGATLKSIEDLTLKQIYRVLAGKDAF